MFKHHSIRWISLLLTVLILLCTVSCAKPQETPAENPGQQEGNTPTEENTPPTEQTTQAPSIPETLKGGGATIVIQTEGWAGYAPLDVVDIGIESRNNDSLNDAAYGRDRQIEEMLDVIIEARQYSMPQESQAQLSTLVNSGSCDVDFCLVRSGYFTGAVTGNLLSDLDSAALQYFDADAPYWDRNSYDALSIAGVHYGLTGDFTVADDATYWCVFFNKQLIEDYQLSSPYDIVKEGKWTYEEMYEMAQVVSADLDGEEGPTYGDRFGISMIRDILCGALNTAGVTILEKDEDDLPVLNFYTEENVDIMLELLDIFYDTDVCYNVHVQGGNEVEIFTNGNVLFTLGGMYYGPQMRSADMEFGILPMPKYDKYQEYISATSPLFLSVLCLPHSDSNDSALKGAFMELYAYLGSEQIVPEYHDRLLKYKVTRDEQSREMLEYVFGNTVYDIGGLFNFADITFAIGDMMYTYDDNIASMWAGKEGQINAAIEAMLEALEQ
ncbi:MAG: extracellular solute-binding protein [Clostridia bacterium]|nr:extracellular solute-binding protein [Clostridia bacterium]